LCASALAVLLEPVVIADLDVPRRPNEAAEALAYGAGNDGQMQNNSRSGVRQPATIGARVASAMVGVLEWSEAVHSLRLHCCTAS
uniref:RNase H domain-containing protein n=1 Tax=Heligmosomoides polygyrus TaxID=6339 RepID=A0A183F7D0_HELPZ